MIVPNPESALNEEAGKLLLEHYEDYAKRARLYTSIQATIGKNEFTALSQDRSSVLKPLSNTTSASPIISNKKRPQEQQENIKEDQPQIKKPKIKKNDKKKALRRL